MCSRWRRNGARLSFDRTNVGVFNLDIGTTETLIVNGVGGNDEVTVNALAGVASLTTLNMNGFDGNDLFTFVPASAGAVQFNVQGGPGTDTVLGPNAASTWNVTAASLGNITGLVSSFRFVEALTGGTASDTFNVRAFTTGTPTVAGGAGADTLNYNAQSRPVSGDRTPPDGLIDSPGVQSVPFSQIEAVNIINSQPPTVDLNGDGRGDVFLYNVANGAYSNQVQQRRRRIRRQHRRLGRRLAGLSGQPGYGRLDRFLPLQSGQRRVGAGPQQRGRRHLQLHVG